MRKTTVGFLRTGAVAATGFAVLLGATPMAPRLAGGMPEAHAQSSLLRNQARTQNRVVAEQVRRAFRPTLKILRGSTGAVTSAGLSSDGRYLITTLEDRSLRVWDLQLGSQVAALVPAVGVAGQASAGPNGDMVAAIDADGAVLLTSPWDQEMVHRLAQPRGGKATAARLSADGGRLLVGRSDGSVALIDSATQKSLLESAPASSPAAAVAMSPDGSLLVSGHADGTVRIWQAPAAGAPPATATPPVGQWRTGGAVTALRVVGGDGAGGTVLALVGDAQGVVSSIALPTAQQVGRWQAHAGAVTDISRHVAGTIVSGGVDGAVSAWRLPQGAPAGKLLEKGPRVNSVALSTDGRTAFAAGASGSVKLLDVQTPGERAQMISTRSGWLVVDANGRFDGDDAGLKDVGWDAEKQVLPVGNFAAKYFEPGIAPKAMGLTQAPVLTAAAPPVNAGILLPPAIEIEVASPAPYAPGQPVELRVVATDDGGGGLEGIRLFLNGKRVDDATLADRREEGNNQQKRWTYTYRVPAVAGSNAFSAVARGWSGIESEPQTASLDAQAPQAAPPAQGNVVARVAGINKYAGSQWNLDYAVADAEAIVELIEDKTTGVYGKVDVTLITDAQAKRQNILSMLAGLNNVQPQDAVVVFLSGHGQAIGDEWYFMPHEMTDLESEEQAKTLGISSTEITEMLVKVPAQRILLIIDACQSGAAATRFDGFAQRRAMQGLTQDTGVFVLAATRADQLAPEYPALKHGLFTYTLLVGMKANKKGFYNADETPPDNTVTAAELKNYVEKNVPVLARLLDMQLQRQTGVRGTLAQRAPVTPTGIALGQDFALSTVQ